MDTAIKPAHPLHHSYSDWDFIGSNWPYYDDTGYTSAPTSLCGRQIKAVPYQGNSLLKTYTNLPQLQLVQNIMWYFVSASAHYDYFRAQDLPGPADFHPATCYYLRFHSTQVAFGWSAAGLRYILDYHNFAPPLVLGQWYQYRFSLSDFPNHITPTAIAFKFELYQAGVWNTYLENMASPSRWYNSLTNRFGIWLFSGGNYDKVGNRIDDTQIFVPTL